MSEESRIDATRKTYESAVALHRQGRLAEAEAMYLVVHREYPTHPGVLHGLGLVRLQTKQPESAVPLLAKAAELAPHNKAIHADLARAYLSAGRYERAITTFTEILRQWPTDTAAQLGVGDASSVLGRLPEARAAFETLLATDPAHPAAHFGLGSLAMQTGDIDAARWHFARASAGEPKQARYHRALAETARFTANDPLLGVLEALSPDSDGQRVERHFALAKAYDDLARYDDAFAHLKAGNELQRKSIAYEERSIADFFKGISAAFSRELMRNRAGAGNPSDLPVFIVGMPRSGTTLVEQILASHPDVHGAGELLFLNDLVAETPNYPAGIGTLPDRALKSLGRRYVEQVHSLGPKARRIVDKLPANFRHLGLIHLALPNAKIIHVSRDPIDTCFSCYSKLFLGGLNFAYDLGELGRYYRMYEMLMAHWHIVLPESALLEVQYETLVSDFEPQARRIVEFNRLSWDPRCLDFAKTNRSVRTLSQVQVRQPLFASSVGRWRHYEKHLQSLRDALR